MDKLKKLLKELKWVIGEGRWFKLIIIALISGILLKALQEFLFSTSFIWGLLFGIIITIADFISGYYDGWSISKWVLEWLE